MTHSNKSATPAFIHQTHLPIYSTVKNRVGFPIERVFNRLPPISLVLSKIDITIDIHIVKYKLCYTVVFVQEEIINWFFFPWTLVHWELNSAICCKLSNNKLLVIQFAFSSNHRTKNKALNLCKMLWKIDYSEFRNTNMKYVGKLNINVKFKLFNSNNSFI